jgi:hypothetical protein
LLLLATSIAERHGAEQMLAGAPPSARETHRFLARLGFAPLVVRRVVATSALRRRLAGENQRRGLDDLLSRRRSLRARSLRSGWGGRSAEPGGGPDGDRDDGDRDGDRDGDGGSRARRASGRPPVPDVSGAPGAAVIEIVDAAPQHVDLSPDPVLSSSPGTEATRPAAERPPTSGRTPRPR